MAAKPFNTDTRFDWIAALVLFSCVLYGVDWALGERLAWGHVVKDAPWHQLSILAAILLLAALSRGVAGRLLPERVYDPARAIVMSIAGSAVGLVAGTVLMMGLLILFSFLPAALQGSWALYLVQAPAFLCPGVWAGWRVGRWGYAVGALAPGFCIAGMYLMSRGESFLPGRALLLIVGLALGSIGGRLGEARFQKVKARNDAAIGKAMHLPEPTG